MEGQRDIAGDIEQVKISHTFYAIGDQLSGDSDYLLVSGIVGLDVIARFSSLERGLDQKTETRLLFGGEVGDKFSVLSTSDFTILEAESHFHGDRVTILAVLDGSHLSENPPFFNVITISHRDELG